MNFRIAVVQLITNPISEDKKNITDAIDFMHLFLDRMREIWATTDTITSLQVRRKQSVLGQQRLRVARGDVSAHP